MNLETKIHHNELIDSELSKRIAYIDSFKVDLSLLEEEPLHKLGDLRNIATVQSIGSSTRIEGSTLSDAEVDTLIKDIKITTLESREEQEVAGYYDCLDVVLESYESMPLSENIIKQLHSILLKYSAKDTSHRGAYKNLSNKVVASYPDGMQRVIFKTTEPHLTAIEMEALIAWTNEALLTKTLHPVLVVSLFVYEFLSIHPFQDGNGRLSRLLTTLLLLQNGYKFVQYISFENQIEVHKEEYYKALMSGQKNRNLETESVNEFILFFTECISVLTDKLKLKISELISKKAVYLNDRHKKIIALLKKNGLMKFADFEKSMKTVSAASLKKDLLYLSSSLAIKKQGKLKATIYSL